MVVVKSFDGSEETFASSTIDTVDVLKEAILERLGIALESQVLVHQEKELEAGTVLASVGIAEDTTVTLSTKEGETLREVFRRFDLNGDGTIDRAELGTVLKEVDPEAWTDGRVDELFKSFDASKDALIQVEEFCEWLGLAGVSGCTSVDVITKTMGEVLMARVSTDISFNSTYNDDEDFHCVTLKADGSYTEVHSREKELSGGGTTQSGTYKIVRSLKPKAPHKVVLYPALESGYGWGGGGGSEYTGKDISSQGAACHSIEVSSTGAVLRHSTDPPFKAKYVAKDALSFQDFT